MQKLSTFRDSLSFMHGNVLVLTISRVLGQLGRSMAFPYASLYILALGGQPEQIGLINSLAPLAGLVLFPIAGYISDHAGRVKLVGLAGYFSGLIFLMFAFAPSWEVIALATVLRGLTVLQFPPTSAIIADSLAPEDRGRGIATMNSLGGLPAIFAPYIAGAIIDGTGVERGMRYLYGFLMLAYVISATINILFLQETSQPKEKLDVSLLPRICLGAYRDIGGLLRRLPAALRGLGGVILLGFLANAIAGPFWVVYAVERIGLTSAQWGLILLVETALRNGMLIPAGLVVDRCGRAHCMRASLLLSLLTVPLFVVARGFIAVLLIRVAVAVANAFFLPACSALMADLVPRELRGRVMAALGRGSVMIGAAGGGTGGPGLGFLVTIPLMITSFSAGYLYAFEATLPWIVAAVALALSFALSLRVVRDPRQAQV